MQAQPENLQLLSQEENNTLQVQAIVKWIKISVKPMKDHSFKRDLGLSGLSLSVESVTQRLLMHLQK